MNVKRLALALLLYAGSAGLLALQQAPVRTELVAHPADPGKRIEIAWARPAGEGPWPVLLLVHGHQIGERPGAKMYVDNGTLEQYASRGMLAAAVSQPGYGRSDGPPDFCGPRSQQAVIAAIAHLRSLPFVDARRVAVFGYSRGAIVAAMVSSQVPDLSAVILGAGIYDLKETFGRLAPDIQANIGREAGLADEAFRARSAIHHVELIKAPTLILHGELDDRASSASARRFGSALEATGTTVRVVVFPGVGHGIPRVRQDAEVNPFLEKHLLGRF